MKTMVFLLAGSFLLTLQACDKKCKPAARCELKPETGPCLAIIQKYYFDNDSKTCKTFNWGGCGGVVPFETKEECEKQCLCK